ncbi:RdgB/HAM1 family non-canonical purine NTP pyrophosphatase [Acidithiobacillus ferriphilus]|uniref:RdgB/HAM1 family non-canonical purine NTP pyrophosphatase n=1 Tax=Acidithiobacillus ferriphilus TaxID=1689834 RepID=UPI001C065046|nr:RdgB/HAM1 family non-canonical purine NTP pyrophosphatase [Acidithiobacillus ferriphilus]MBU2830609.1 RdgB/HAM1 family non-canonical purine NTP pyrophosphatase [Acidithiobacillus ferriphilus]
MTPLLLATGNAGKVRELQPVLAARGFAVVGQTGLGISSIAETGLTFVENALLKARHAASQSGMATLAEDSGLCVPYLQGAPGLHSARYAGPEASAAANNAKLLTMLTGVEGAARAAYYVACMVFLESAADPSPLVAQGFWQGVIGEHPVGGGGFGYDPLFRPAGGRRSAAQWSLEEKNDCSHRALALRRLLALLAERQAPQPLSLND